MEEEEEKEEEEEEGHEKEEEEEENEQVRWRRKVAIHANNMYSTLGFSLGAPT